MLDVKIKDFSLCWLATRLRIVKSLLHITREVMECIKSPPVIGSHAICVYKQTYRKEVKVAYIQIGMHFELRDVQW